MDVSNYTQDCGAPNIPGVKTKVWMVCACDVATFPARLATTGVGDSITLDGNIVLAAGKAFATFDVISETGKITHSAVGSLTSKNFNNSFDGKTAKDIGSDEWFDKHINACFVVIIEEKDGTKRVLGEPGIPCFIDSAEGTTGDDSGSEKSWIFKMWDKTGKVAPIYTGTIDVTV